MLPPDPLLTHLVTPPIGFALLESSLTTTQRAALEDITRDLGAAYAERLMREGTLVPTDPAILAPSYLLALRTEQVLPPGIFAVISSRWLAAPVALLSSDPRVQWFLDAFTDRYSVPQTVSMRARMGQR